MKNKNYSALILLLSLFGVVTASFGQIVPDKFKLKTIVIDAGHGGHDTGTNGKFNKEKDVALQYSLKLGEKISREMPEVNVLYTRKSDKFIPLKDRAHFANSNDADLFISIHCNGGSTSASGTETFVLGLHRNEDNLKVAMRENTSILLEDDYSHHYGNFDPASPEAYILFNLFQSANLDQSLDIASTIERQFSSEGRKSRGVKQAGFLVLRETTMPSILVETGFLTNSDDERFMTSTNGNEKIVEAIFQGVKAYKAKLDAEALRILQKNEAYVKQQEVAKEKAWAWPSIRSLDLKGNNYFIQVMVSKDADKKDFGSFKNIAMSKIDVINSYKYLIGPYQSKAEADAAHKKAQDEGFRDAYILQFKDNKLQR